MGKLTHIGRDGRARMVAVDEKPITARFAVAGAEVSMKPDTLRQIRSGRTKKGNVIETARIAGISAAKQTSSLIPLCHPIALTNVVVDISVRPPRTIEIRARAEALDRTGVEMEALTAAAVAGLTIYDMVKALDRDVEITRLRLLEKAGGKSGHYMRLEKRKR